MPQNSKKELRKNEKLGISFANKENNEKLIIPCENNENYKF